MKTKILAIALLGSVGCGDSVPESSDNNSKFHIVCNDGWISSSCTSCTQGCCSDHGGCGTGEEGGAGEFDPVPCLNDSDCENSLSCVDNICQIGYFCEYDEDCLSSQICNTLMNECESSRRCSGTTISECDVHGVCTVIYDGCPDGFACTEDVCLKK